MRNKPAYAIESVDKALLLATLIHREGPQRVTDAADLVGVSVSTAHRLFAMLVYRGFAVQLDDRRYGPGPLLSSEPMEASLTPLRRLRNVTYPHLVTLARATRETAVVAVRVGLEVRVIATVESSQPLRVGDRTGFTFPALDSGMGRILLANSDPAVVDALIAEAGVDRDATLLALAEARERGYDMNESATEEGVSGVGIGFEAYDDCIGLAIAMPTTRYTRSLVPGFVGVLHRVAAAIQRDLAQE